MESYGYNLPVEHWWQVLVNVSPRDLCNVALTSRHMNSLAELWNGMKVSRSKWRKHGLAVLYPLVHMGLIHKLSR